MKPFAYIFLFVLIFSLSATAQPYGNYTLYSIQNSTKAYLINLDGTTYHSWTFASSKPTGYSSYLLPGGIILRTVARSGNSFTGGPICGEVQKVDWNGNVIWDYVYSTTEYCSHHDICPMPNGNVLLIAYEAKTPTQVSSAGCSQSITMWPEKIVEIQPVGTSGGNVVWEWHVWDHLSQNLYPAKSNYVTSVVNHPELININYLTQKDWLHANGIDYNETLDQIVFSSHNLNEIYVIDHSTTTAQAASHSGGNSGKGGDILYRWGNPAAYQASGTTNFNVVHDAHWIPQGHPRANYLVGFNNKGGTGNKSCIDFIATPYNGNNYSITTGSAFLPATFSWRHTYSGTATQNEGNSQQLPNGNTLMNISLSGYMYEIDSNQNVVWSKTVSGTNTSAFRYTDCYVNSIGRADAYATPSSVCQGTSTQLNAEGIGGSGYTYSWTSNPAGFTSALKNPVTTPLSTTTYYVTIQSGTCTATDSVKVIVTGPVSVAANSAASAVCLGRSTQLNAVATGGSIYAYSWSSNPAGFTSTLQNPTVSPLVQTTYTCTVTSGLCNASSSVTINVSSPITVSTSANPLTINLGGLSQLQASAAGGSTYTYSWVSDPPGFTSSLPNPIVSPTETTLYTVTASSEVCTANSSISVTQTGILPSLAVSPALQTVTSSAGTSVFTITSNVDWTASSDQSWCTVTTSGTGNSNLIADFTENTTGDSRSAFITVIVNGLNPVTVTVTQSGTDQHMLYITAILEGLFNGTTMNQLQNSTGPLHTFPFVDEITVELHSSVIPFSLIEGPFVAEINNEGEASVGISAVTNGSYYIVLKHRNHIESWSKVPVVFNSGNVTYDFTDAASKAYGNNLKNISGKYVLFCGDVNQDGLIDAGDMIPLDNGSAGTAISISIHDLNGDGFLNNLDMQMLDANAALFSKKLTPE